MPDPDNVPEPGRQQPTPQIRSLCVYCGSAGAVSSGYRTAASELGAGLAKPASSWCLAAGGSG